MMCLKKPIELILTPDLLRHSRPMARHWPYFPDAVILVKNGAKSKVRVTGPGELQR
jgi:hypothetical protein